MWKTPNFKTVVSNVWSRIGYRAVKNTIKSTSTFVVVTFTSRQAAVTARHSLLDGRKYGRWIAEEDVPVPPLADAAVFDWSCTNSRGCCKPVTMTINPRQQRIRRYVMTFMIICIYIFWTIPVTIVIQTDIIDMMTSYFVSSHEEKKISLNKFLTSNLPAWWLSIVFAICPIIFRSLSNFGSAAISLQQSDIYTLKVCFICAMYSCRIILTVVLMVYHSAKYHWGFILLSVFYGSTITNMAVKAYHDKKLHLGDIFHQLAKALPEQVCIATIFTSSKIFHLIKI